MDEEGNEVAQGETGEICARGPQVMKGYWQRPDETEKVFFDDWFRTGDIGKMNEDGFFQIVDRKKDMILSGGQNIYPQDIEAVLMTHKDVNAAAVIGAVSKKWGETPFAVLEAEDGVSEDEIIKWANARLGKQQRLAGAVFTATLPRNANGKTLKTKLRTDYKDICFD